MKKILEKYFNANYISINNNCIITIVIDSDNVSFIEKALQEIEKTKSTYDKNFIIDFLKVSRIISKNEFYYQYVTTLHIQSMELSSIRLFNYYMLDVDDRDDNSIEFYQKGFSETIEAIDNFKKKYSLDLEENKDFEGYLFESNLKGDDREGFIIANADY